MGLDGYLLEQSNVRLEFTFTFTSVTVNQVNLPIGHFEADKDVSSVLISAATKNFNSLDVCVRCSALATG